MQYPKRLIKLGESDPNVMRALRERLTSMGYKCAPEGSYDADFLATVRLFQTGNVDHRGANLSVDGEIGPLTWARIFRDPPEKPEKPEKHDSALSKEAVMIARTQIGVREVPPDSNYGPEVEMYLSSVGTEPGNPWCAAFVYWCLNQAALSKGVSNPCPRKPGVLDQWRYATRAGVESLSSNVAKDDPSLIKPGMVFVIDSGKGRGHTGFVTGSQGGVLATIEGNTDASKTREGGGVYVLSRRVSEINVGYLMYR